MMHTVILLRQMTDIQAMSLCMVVIVQLSSCNKEWKRDTFPICNYCICMYIYKKT